MRPFKLLRVAGEPGEIARQLASGKIKLPPGVPAPKLVSVTTDVCRNRMLFRTVYLLTVDGQAIVKTCRSKKAAFSLAFQVRAKVEAYLRHLQDGVSDGRSKNYRPLTEVHAHYCRVRVILNADGALAHKRGKAGYFKRGDAYPLITINGCQYIKGSDGDYLAVDEVRAFLQGGV
jgi:hypothetical protein